MHISNAKRENSSRREAEGMIVQDQRGAVFLILSSGKGSSVTCSGEDKFSYRVTASVIHLRYFNSYFFVYILQILLFISFCLSYHEEKDLLK